MKTVLQGVIEGLSEEELADLWNGERRPGRHLVGSVCPICLKRITSIPDNNHPDYCAHSKETKYGHVEAHGLMPMKECFKTTINSTNYLAFVEGG